MNAWTRPFALFGVAASCALGNAAFGQITIKIQPDETAGKDVLTYQLSVGDAGFDISTAANVTNLDTDTLATDHPMSIIGAVLGTALTNEIDHESINDGVSEVTGNSAHTWIQFALPVIDSGDVISASLNLWALDGEGITGAFANPSVGKEVVTRVYDAGNTWDEQAITWETEPAHGDFVTQATQDAVEQWVEFDVTSIVVDWLNGSKDNNGLFLDQEAVIPDVRTDPDELAGLEDVVASLYSSSAWGDSTVRPFLEINVVPEPASLALLATGGLFLLRRRR